MGELNAKQTSNLPPACTTEQLLIVAFFFPHYSYKECSRLLTKKINFFLTVNLPDLGVTDVFYGLPTFKNLQQLMWQNRYVIRALSY